MILERRGRGRHDDLPVCERLWQSLLKWRSAHEALTGVHLDDDGPVFVGLREGHPARDLNGDGPFPLSRDMVTWIVEHRLTAIGLTGDGLGTDCLRMTAAVHAYRDGLTILQAHRMLRSTTIDATVRAMGAHVVDPDESRDILALFDGWDRRDLRLAS